jgi:acetylglutamate/LysW-gamma-L-alpha-aminoadipate kinase
MRIKLLAARRALHGGVPRVVIADGRCERPIARALDGEGTVLVGSPSLATDY